MTEDAVTFDTAHQSSKQTVTEIKMGSSGVIRKRNGGFVQMNDNAEKFKKINTGAIAANNSGYAIAVYQVPKPPILKPQR